MKSLFLTIATIVLFQSAFIQKGFPRPYPVSETLLTSTKEYPAKNEVPKPNWQLKTDDTYMTITVINNHPAVYELKNTINSWNWIQNFSEMPLPEKVQVDGKLSHPDWKYRDADVDQKNGTTVSLHFMSNKPNLELISIWQAKPGTGPIENSVTIKNKTGKTITFQYADVVSADLNLTANAPINLWRFNKARYLGLKIKGDNPVVNTHPVGMNDTVSYFLCNDAVGGGINLNTYLPFQIFDINSKHGLYIGYEWSFGTFKNITGKDPQTVNYSARLWDTSSVSKGDGEVFNVPAVFFGCYTGDADDGSNKMKRWFWLNKITPTLRNNPSEPLIEYCIPGNEAQLIEYYKKYPVAGWGAELGKIDIDWLDGSGSDWTKGDFKKYTCWKPDSLKWPNGMTGGDICHRNKQRLSLYMNFTFEGNDIGTPSGREKEKDALLTRFDNWHYDYWRSDMVLEAKFSYLSHEGLLEILDYMIANRPEFRYEHCANGGTLKDFTTLQRITMLTNEDSGGADYHRESFYSCSYMINPVQLKTDVGMNLGPHGEVPKGTGFNTPGCINDTPEWVKYVLRTGFLGANMATNWCDYTPNQIAGVKEHWPLYKTKQRPVLRGAKVGDTPADVYHILPIPDGTNWDGIEYFNTSLNKGSVLLFKPSKTAPDSRVIKLKGLKRTETYSLSFQDRKDQNTKMTGTVLMEKGVEVKEMKGDYASEIIWIN